MLPAVRSLSNAMEGVADQTQEFFVDLPKEKKLDNDRTKKQKQPKASEDGLETNLKQNDGNAEPKRSKTTLRKMELGKKRTTLTEQGWMAHRGTQYKRLRVLRLTTEYGRRLLPKSQDAKDWGCA
jgi:putative salt-induced outer membrane protein YdiY